MFVRLGLADASKSFAPLLYHSRDPLPLRVSTSDALSALHSEKIQASIAFGATIPAESQSLLTPGMVRHAETSRKPILDGSSFHGTWPITAGGNHSSVILDHRKTGRRRR